MMSVRDISSVQQVSRQKQAAAQEFSVRIISNASTKIVKEEFAPITTRAKYRQAQ